MLFLVAALSLSFHAADVDAVSRGLFERFELASGVRLFVLHSAAAPRESIFSFVPLGLASDGPGQAQWSHLVEHMLIRSNDPEGFSSGGVTLNGETMASSLRLDTYAEPDQWRSALARHVRWLSTREFDAEVLEREKSNIASEEEITLERGATGKWAVAAWNQIVRCGREHAAVHGDVAGAEVDALAAYVGERVHIGPGITFIAAGPVEPEELRGALEEEFALSEDSGVGKEGGGRGKTVCEASRLFDFGDACATWDLDAWHYLEWYALPARSPEERLAAEIIAERVAASLSASKEPLLAGGRATAGSEIETADGRVLLLSVSVDSGTDIDGLREVLADLLAHCAEDGKGRMPLSMSIMQMGMQSAVTPNFSALRRRFGSSPAADLVEGQVALGLFSLEARTGIALTDLAGVCQALDPDSVRAIAKESLVPGRRSSLLLEPGR